MPLDTSLLAVRPGEFSLPSTSANELLAQATLKQKQQEMESQNALRKATQGLDLNTSEGQQAYVNALRAGGYHSEAQDFVNKLATQKKTEAETQATQMDIFNKNKDTISKLFLDAANNPSDENLIAHANTAVTLGLDKDMVGGMLSDIFTLPPEQRAAAIRNFGLSAEKQVELNKPTKLDTQVVELNGRKKLVNTQTGDVIKDLGSAATAASQDDRNTVSFRETADDGTVTMFNKYGEQIGTTKGKKSATVVKTEVARTQLGKDLDNAIYQLTEASKPGGLIDQSTGSGIGKLVDVGAGFFGGSTTGSRAIASMAPIYDLVLKMVPRFEGPQSDKDTMSYNKAAGQLADPSTPTGDKKAAAATILNLMKARKNQFTTKEATDAGVTSTSSSDVRSQADAIIGAKK